jgi:general secretion pathway protein M
MLGTSRSTAGLVAVGILGLALVLAGLAAAMPFVRTGWIDQSITEKQDELLQLRRQIAREADLRKENAALAAAGENANGLLLQGGTTGISGANLQKLMSGLVIEHGGTALSFQLLPPAEDGHLTRIPMSLSISVGIDGLRDIIHDLETGTPLIFIDDITIQAATDEVRTPDPHFLGPLDVVLQVSGFALKNGAS